jgi:PPOX class probable F420-dependent enzyme
VKLTETEARNRLAGARVARLATTGADRQPHLVPVTFAVTATNDGDRVYIAIDHKPKTTLNLRRLRNIRENPRVALLADHYEDDWDLLWWARADGHARILETGEERQKPLDVLAAKYSQYRQIRPEGPVIAIDTLRWTGWAA